MFGSYEPRILVFLFYPCRSIAIYIPLERRTVLKQEQYQVVLGEDLDRNLAMYCRIMAVSKDNAVREAVSRLVEPYTPDANVPLKAVYHIPGEKDATTSCWYLGETSSFGSPYRRIVVNGMLMKVPAECVDIIGF